MIENQGKPDIDNLLRKISNYVTDYDGSRIVRGAEPMPGLHCGVLYEAADTIEALRTSLADLRHNYEYQRERAEAAEERCATAMMDGHDLAKEEYRDQIRAAEARAETARRDALEEAAIAVHEAWPDMVRVTDISGAIRALAEKESKEQVPCEDWSET